jgi:hypothetical protein
MGSTVEQIRSTVEGRLRELQPMIEELERLQRILALLDDEAAFRGTADGASARLRALLAQVDINADGIPRQPIRRSRRGTKPGRDGRAPRSSLGKKYARVVRESVKFRARVVGS